MANEVFISYSRKDFDKVRQIKESIDKELGIDCWMDLDGIESGDQFKEVIISAILRHDIVLFMMTANSMNSPWALKELNFAEKKKKRIVLVDIGHSPMTDSFMFDYGDKDNINWDDKIQHDKLIKNLRNWIENIRLPQKTILEVDDKNDSLKKEKMSPSGKSLEHLEKMAPWFEAYGDYKMAFSLYLQAAELGAPKAQKAVAKYYYEGIGVNKDLREALKWYEKAASGTDGLNREDCIQKVKEIRKQLKEW